MLILTLSRTGAAPVFRQIVEQVRFQVAAGVLPAGLALPSTRALAQEHGLNPMTVSKAYAELEREGVLERRPGQNHVVAAVGGAQGQADRRVELARALEAAVIAARQLGIGPAEAAALFHELCAEQGSSEVGPSGPSNSPDGSKT